MAWEQMTGRDLNSYSYASVCLCAELSVSLVVTVVPILLFFSQVTNCLISAYETTVDIAEADVNVTVMYMHFQNLSMTHFFKLLSYISPQLLYHS